MAPEIDIRLLAGKHQEIAVGLSAAAAKEIIQLRQADCGEVARMSIAMEIG